MKKKHWICIIVILAIAFVIYWFFVRKKPATTSSYNTRHMFIPTESKYSGYTGDGMGLGQLYGSQFQWMDPNTAKSDNIKKV